MDMIQKKPPNLTCRFKLKLKLKASWKFSEENMSDPAHGRVGTKCEYCNNCLSNYY